MTLFFILIGKLLPLYAFILLGWFAGTWLKVQRDSVAMLLLYILSPIVIIEGVLSVPITASTLSLVPLFFVLCSALCGLFYLFAIPLWKDPTRNLAAFASANGNTGYFGIPVAIALLGEGALGYIVLGSMGFLLYESSVGFFTLTRGNSTVRESIRKVLRLPILYAFLFGLLLRFLAIDIPPAVATVIVSVRGAYGILGMLVIGLGLAGMPLAAVDGKLLAFTGLAKFLVWPLLMLGIIALDTSVFHFYTADIHQALFLLSIVPLAVNTVILATVAKVHPSKAAVAVLVSTVIALFAIPAWSMLIL